MTMVFFWLWQIFERKSEKNPDYFNPCVVFQGGKNDSLFDTVWSASLIDSECQCIVKAASHFFELINSCNVQPLVLLK